MDSDEVHKITSIGEDDYEDGITIFRGFWGSGIVQAGLIVVAFKIVNVIHDIALEKLRVDAMRIKAEQKNQN